MQQIATILRAISVFALCALTSIALRGQAKDSAASGGGVLELTETDVLANHDWTSEAIRVLGFHLGMSRAGAVENAHKRNLNLNCLRNCDVCDQQNVLCNGISLRFGGDGNVDAIYVMRPLAESPEDLRKFSVTGEFKGQTYSLFHRYSDALRLKLLGAEVGKVEDRETRTTTYYYPRFGLTVYVDRSANPKVTNSQADLTLSFFRPNSPDTEPPKSKS
jgi:hypothetical protein